MFKLSKNSLTFAGGHSDELSCQSCQILLGLPERYKLVEIIFAIDAVCTQHCIFTLSGAHYSNISLNGVKIEQNKVYEAHKNDILKFGRAEYGFRLYLMASSFDQSRPGIYRGRFEDCFSPPKEKIRLIKGPEFNELKNPREFLDSAFVISANSDLSGLRLEGAKIEADGYDIVSAIVDDGLIQLTPNGPIVLLRQRHVTGGYLRIFSVIKTDLDFLAQYKPGMVVHFELVNLEEAKTLLLQRERELEDLKNKINEL